jgi:TonB family protein
VTATTIILLRAFWLMMADHLWQSTVVLALLFVLSRTLRNAPPRLRNTYWRLGLLKLLLPLPLLSPLLPGLLPAPGHPGATAAFPRMAEMIHVTWAPASTLSEAAGSIGPSPQPALLALTCLWAAGSLILLGLFGRDALRSHRRRAEPLVNVSGPLASRIAQALVRTVIPPGRVRLTTDGTMPAATGLLRRHIIVPLRLVLALPVESLRSVLLHEDAHCRRHDVAFAYLGRLALVLFFFHPLVWLLNRRLAETAELAADEAVLAAGIPASSYRRTLARSIRLALDPASTPAMAGPGNRSFLSRRLSLLSLPRKDSAMLRHRLLVSSCAALVLAMLFASPPPQAGGGVTEPVLIADSRVQPEYPEAARKAGISGNVVLEAIIDPDGVVLDVKVVSHPDEGEDLAQAAAKALRQWRYQPAQLDGQPVESSFTVVVKFSLDSKKDHAGREPESGRR